MGVPKFYRWISERYPCLSTVVKEYQIPEFDNLYLDMNGIIHVCSHPNDEDPHFRITEETIFLHIFNYIDFLFRMIKPRKTFFMAVDGVAPRAKMNQQRGRRFRSAKEAVALEKQALIRGEVLPTEARFDSNCISPGTSFMANLQEQLEQFVAAKISTDPLWQGVSIYLSGHQTPGEGEHKIMDFIRTERSRPDYDPNTRHCLYGLDADLIMLGTCSHEPHFALLREEIVYGKRQSQKRLNVPEEMTFHLLHLSLLREYLSYEFQAVKDTLPFEFSLESIVDDWVLMCFLVGNDFLPHLPNLHIAHNALPMLYQAYMEVLPKLGGYINEQGILNLERFEKFLKRLSQFDYEQFTDIQADQKFLESKRVAATAPNGVVSQDNDPAREKERDPDEQRLLDKFSHLDIPDYESDDESEGTLEMEFRQHKRDYYTSKLEYKDVNKEVMQDQARGYVRAIQWNLHYYYNGVQSWNWYYPHHYSPYISDIKDFQNFDMSFELGKPFLPFQQLMSILPAASKDLVPKAYQALMESEESPVLDYYPKDFTTDLNGKQQEWEAVVLIPFIDEDRLLPVMQELDSKLTDEERERNSHGGHLLFTFSHEPVAARKHKKTGLLPNVEANHARVEVLDQNVFRLPMDQIKKGILEGVNMDVYFAGFPTFRHLPHTARLGRASVKVFQSISRNESMVLNLTEIPEKTVKEVADDLLGKSVHVNWPHLLEALVVAVMSKDERFTFGVGHAHQTDSDVKVFEMREVSISERYRSRYGVNLGDIDIIVLCKTITGRKYICGPKGRITLEKQWSVHPVAFALQSLVKDIAEHSPELEQFKTVEELFPVGKTCFMLGHPHYGCQGEVVDPKPSNKLGRIVVKLNIPSEPNLEGVVRNEQNLSQVHYMSSHQLAQWLGVHGLFVSRITGTVYIQMNSREADVPSLVNVGLNLKFNKSGEEVPGYSKRAKETWFYSNKCYNVLRDYLTKFADFVEKVLPFMDRDRIGVEDIYPGGEGKEEVREVAKWIKEQECAQLPRVKSGSEALDEGVIKAIEDTVDKLKEKDQQRCTILDVQPKSLFRAALHCGWMQPDPSATFRLFDRVVNVRENITVPLGLRGTITGICKVEEGEPTLCEVVFDKEFVGGLSLRCSPNRGYKLSTLSLVNLSHGTRSQRGQQLYQVPARRQEQHAQATSPKKAVSYARATQANQVAKDQRWNSVSPQHRQSRNRFHHSPNSPFEPQKSSPAPEPPTDGGGTTDFASLWMGLERMGSQPAATSANPALPTPAPESSQHHGKPVSIEELFKDAEMQHNIESPPISALAELMQRTKESMGSEPFHYVIAKGDTKPLQRYKAFVILPGGKEFTSESSDKESALQDAARQALFYVSAAGSLQTCSVAPTAVPAKRPSVPMPFGNAPPASALPGLRMRLPPPCDAALIPDSFVETNRLLLESLNKLGPPPAEEVEQKVQQVSWQTPRMAPPFPMPTGVPGQAPSLVTTEQPQHNQRMPFYHVPAPMSFGPRQLPTFFTYQQQQQQHHPSQPQFDPMLRPRTRPLLMNEMSGQGMIRHQQPQPLYPQPQQLPKQQQHLYPQPQQLHQQPQHLYQQPRQMHQQLHQQAPQPYRQISTQGVGRNGEMAESDPPHGKQPSAAGYAFVPTQVLRNKAPPPPKSSTTGKVSKNEKKSEDTVLAAAAMPPKTAPAAQNRQPTSKQNSQQQEPKSDTVIRGKKEGEKKVSSVSSAKDVPPSDSKPKQRRSRLAVKFDAEPGAT